MTRHAYIYMRKTHTPNLNDTDTQDVEFYIRALPWGDMSAVEDVLRLSHDGVNGMHRVHADFVVGADIVYGQQDDVLDALYDTITACLSSQPPGSATFHCKYGDDFQKYEQHTNEVTGTQVLIAHKEREGSATYQQSQRSHDFMYFMYVYVSMFVCMYEGSTSCQQSHRYWCIVCMYLSMYICMQATPQTMVSRAKMVFCKALCV
jgi:hypothetical protein